MKSKRSIITRLFYKIDRDELSLRTFVHIIIPNRATAWPDLTKSEQNIEHGSN